MEMHEREQGEALRNRAHGMFGQKRGQPDGFIAKLASDRLFGVRGEVSLVEKKIEHAVHAGQPGVELLQRRRLHVRWRLVQSIACAAQTLAHVGFGREQPQCDFRSAEAAQCFQSQASWASSALTP